MKIRNIRFKYKLIFSYLFVIFFSFGFVAFFLDKQLENNSLQEIKTSLINQANLINNQISFTDINNENISDLEASAKALSQKVKCRITIVNNKGRVLADSEESEEAVLRMENHKYRPEIKSALSGDIGIAIRYSTTLKINMLYVAIPMKDQGSVISALRLALPLTNIQKTLFTIRKIIFLGLGIALFLTLAFTSLVTMQTIKPINKMIEVSRKFSEGDFTHRIIQLSHDEIGGLASALNSMAQDIEDKINEISIQNQKLAAILKSMVEGVIVTDKSARVISINQTVERIFDVKEGDVKGKFILEAIRNNELSEIIGRVLKENKSSSQEISLNLPVRGIFQVNAVPIFEKSIASGCLVVIHDITEIRRLETIRRDFVANVSHELKTPLTSIKGFVETLLEGALEDKQHNRNFLKIIQEHADRLNSLVNDLLSLSHLESKEMPLNMENIDLQKQVGTVALGFKSQLEKKSIKIENRLPPGLRIMADKDRIEQVITNLIDNAIKFNREKGAIKIYGQDSGNNLKIIVEDTGIGIPEKDIPRIFERFYRVDKARSRELGGTGLGLSIVKHIIELHGGSVGVESTEGLGSKFYFFLPQ